MSMRMLRTAYTVSDMDRSLQFYRDLLGLRVVRDKQRSGVSFERLLGIEGVTLRVVILEDGSSGHLLELVEFLSPPARGRRPREDEIGGSTMCFVVDDVASLHKRLIAADVHVRSEPVDFVQEGRSVGRIMTAFDPDDIPVVLLEKET